MSTRREFIKQVSLITGMGLASSLGLALPGHAASAAGGNWRMPDEGEPQQRAFIAFGAQRAIWRDSTEDVQNALGRIARAIAVYQPVTVFCRESERQLAEEKCGSHNLTFIVTELDDIWMRDIGANFIVNDAGELGAVDFNFNGWGNKQRHAKDARLAAFAAEHYAVAQLRRSALVGEGGGIEVDGHGTGIMTESSWVNRNRNPGWSRDRVEQELKAMLGLRKIIWLPGIKGKDITDAHVDFYARFVRPGVVIANLDTDPESYDSQVTQAHLAILEQATDADGRRLQVHCVSPPLAPRRSRFNKGNPDFAAGYINYFVINGAVIAPEFGDREADAQALERLTALYPEHEVVQVNIDAIAAGGGGIHCVTSQLPAHGR
ncbi:agmatine deiminase family protein [Serratia entomophila]|uniref:agmatine deiminase family protein n=1 Tax=Serratia entomophila TaxID=42906 RepID=UPI00217C5619|nr:agmatine deiminase family protein [Serratia entomophila]CAI0904213.1 Agmatine deiminase [Serratia entomophila]CAI1541069.1 Agmatine deiminase [Serratia entomophila]CAI1591397.1 Agmatine deiminase [Serratia entomophila]CAI1593439.1 Agmatine deiminase [Serratia entomophila]CAI1597602.1 Agmatine deiminase [Serratia entomophila]